VSFLCNVLEGVDGLRRTPDGRELLVRVRRLLARYISILFSLDPA
jgi:hypothetical protein